MKIFILISLLLFFAAKSNAQLPSEKPMDEIYSAAVKQKLRAPKPGAASEDALPSNAALPRQATAAKTKSSTKAVTNREGFKKNQPSNSENILPAVHAPKKITDK